MATVRWVSKAQKTKQLNTITPANVAIGNTFTVTINGKTVTYTAAANTVADVTAGLTALLQACTEPEFLEVTWANATTAITGTANTAGTPFTQTSSAAGGTATLTTVVTTANSSPNDLNNAINYSGGSLPVNGDDLIFDAGDASASVLWNLGSLSAVTLNSLTRRNTFTGAIALPEFNTNGSGYFEYRPTELNLPATTATWEQAASDGVASVKWNAGSAQTTATVRGQGSSAPGFEAMWFRGTHASNVINAEQASLAIAPVAGNAATILTLNAEDSTVRMGSGLTGPTTINNRNSLIEANATFTTLNQTGASAETDVKQAAAATTLTIDDGSVFWLSSGTITTANVGANGTLDFSRDNRTRTVTNKVNLYKGATYNDPAGTTVAGGLSFQSVRCTLNDVTVNVGPNHSFAVT